jgi:glyoxalase family protein
VTPNPPTTAGLHHVSVLARDGRANRAFWTRTMGQRLIKRTVNFDAPTMHHLYYGDGAGRVGTALTFFPIPNAARAVVGTGETAAVAYAVRQETLPFWRDRLADAGREPIEIDRWARPGLTFTDPDGLRIELVGLAEPPEVAGWEGEPVGADARLRGFESVTLRVANAASTLPLLERVGFAVRDERAEGSARRLRLATGSGALGDALDLVEEGRARPRRDGRGSVHHVAFRLPGDAEQEALRDDLLGLGLNVSEVRERTYFRSIYVREPGGVLLEFATDGPGMDVDEPRDALGAALRLPPWLEAHRAEIEARLPDLGPDDENARGAHAPRPEVTA